MIEIFTAACGGFLAGWVCRTLAEPAYSRMQDPDWRRSFNHENTNRPSGPPPLKLRRSREGEWRAEWASINDDGNFSLGLVRARNPSTGYQPRPQSGTPNPPPSEP